ncbi:SusE domain-containing protein [Mucilaginibacter sp.]|uniref:SusE domain-containing protein n=1 Tax=Mucilaginibacter sp. TaxID=1882438 RepID=UPI003D0DDB9E
MKKLLTRLLTLSSIGLLMLTACKKDGALVTSNGGKAGTLVVSSNTIVLDKTKLNDTSTVIHFNISKANYGYSAGVTSTLQIDSMGDNWKNPKTVILGANVFAQKYTTNDFNALMLSLHLTPNQAGQVQVRVSQAISSAIAPVYSNVITLNVTPFSLASYLYVPGAYQGWSPGSAASLVSPNSNNIYSGIINFTGSDLNFKVTSEADWNGTNYGAGSGAGTVSTTGGNLLAPADGGLLVTVNLNANTITFVPQWSIIGDATPGGWGADTNMFYNAGTGTWYITAKLVSDGGQAVKFRLNNAWATNLGGSNGTLTLNGGNISVPNTTPAGAMYNITLDPVANTYTLVKQ